MKDLLRSVVSPKCRQKGRLYIGHHLFTRTVPLLVLFFCVFISRGKSGNFSPNLATEFNPEFKGTGHVSRDRFQSSELWSVQGLLESVQGSISTSGKSGSDKETGSVLGLVDDRYSTQN